MTVVRVPSVRHQMLRWYADVENSYCKFSAAVADLSVPPARIRRVIRATTRGNVNATDSSTRELVGDNILSFKLNEGSNKNCLN